MSTPNTNPIFPLTPNVGRALMTAANTNRDGSTGTYYTALTAGANGSRIERASVKATVTTTAGMIRIWLNNGSVRYLFDEIPVAAITPSGTVAAWSADIPSLAGLILPNGWTIDGSTNNAEASVLNVLGGDY